MNEMNLIRLSQPDYTAFISAAMFPTPATRLQSSRDYIPIVVSPLANNALPLHSAAEQNLILAGEKVISEVAVIPGWRYGKKVFGGK